MPWSALYRAYQSSRAQADDLSSRLADGGEAASPTAHLPSEEVTDMIQRASNHFPDLGGRREHGGGAKLTLDDPSRPRALLDKQLGTQVRIARWGSEPGVHPSLRSRPQRAHARELLPTRSRTFQVAHQIAVMAQGPLIDRIVDAARLTADGVAGLAGHAANYFRGRGAHAVRPVPRGREAGALRHRSSVAASCVGFEQVCHRLTTPVDRALRASPST